MNVFHFPEYLDLYELCNLLMRLDKVELIIAGIRTFSARALPSSSYYFQIQYIAVLKHLMLRMSCEFSFGYKSRATYRTILNHSLLFDGYVFDRSFYMAICDG